MKKSKLLLFILPLALLFIGLAPKEVVVNAEEEQQEEYEVPEEVQTEVYWGTYDYVLYTYEVIDSCTLKVSVDNYKGYTAEYEVGYRRNGDTFYIDSERKAFTLNGDGTISFIEYVEESEFAKLKEQLSKYKDLVENETVRGIIGAIIEFLVVLGALWIKFRSFDKANLTLDNSQAILKIAKDEVVNVTKQVADLSKQVLDGNKNVKELIETFTKQINVINASLVNLTNKVEQLENKKED